MDGPSTACPAHEFSEVPGSDTPCAGHPADVRRFLSGSADHHQPRRGASRRGRTVNAYRSGAADTATQRGGSDQPPEQIGAGLHERFTPSRAQGTSSNPPVTLCAPRAPATPRTRTALGSQRHGTLTDRDPELSTPRLRGNGIAQISAILHRRRPRSGQRRSPRPKPGISACWTSGLPAARLATCS